MTKHFARARRRHELARIKKKRLDYYGGFAKDLPKAERERRAGMFANTMPCCSCSGCGNQRRYWGLPTMREQRAQEAARRDFDE